MPKKWLGEPELDRESDFAADPHDSIPPPCVNTSDDEDSEGHTVTVLSSVLCFKCKRSLEQETGYWRPVFATVVELVELARRNKSQAIEILDSPCPTCTGEEEDPQQTFDPT